MHTRDAIINTFKTAGVAICWDALIVIAGFLILIFSTQPPNQLLGIMIAIGILTSTLSAFLILPIVWNRT
jgi:uncharacterized protein